MGRIFYWLKLKLDFFREKRIRKLRKQAGGDTYTIIYLEMLLLSLPDNGVLYFDGVENDFAEELALELYEEADNVRVTIAYLMAQGLMIQQSEGEYLLLQVPDLVGSETESAARKRKYREKLAKKRDNVPSSCDNVLRSWDNFQKCPTEREIDKEKEIEIDSEREETLANYRGEYENVILLDEEFKKLKAEFPHDYRARIDRLSEYIAQTGKTYKSHYATIRRWAKEDAEKNGTTGGSFDTDSFFEAAVKRAYGDL